MWPCVMLLEPLPTSLVTRTVLASPVSNFWIRFEHLPGGGAGLSTTFVACSTTFLEALLPGCLQL